VTNVLFIVMEFVPLNLAGVRRPLRFINSMRSAGFNPIVVTIDFEDGYNDRGYKIDRTLLSELDPDVTVIRIPALKISSFTDSRWKRLINIYFNRTDNFLKAWAPSLLREMPAIFERYRPKAILATCPPFSGAVLGRDLSRKYRIPLFLDMRDAWAKLSMVPAGSRLHYLSKLRLERTCFRQASVVCTVTPQLRKIFSHSHPGLQGTKFRVIYNAFDMDTERLQPFRSRPIGSEERIDIGYAGSYYYHPDPNGGEASGPWWRTGHRSLRYYPVKEDWSYRSPLYFLRALSLLLQRRKDWRDRVFFNHIGDVPEWLRDMVRHTGLEDNVVFHGHRTHKDTVQLLSGFDYFLATSEKVLGDEHYCLPSKLFTYLRFGKPVLGFLTEGIQANFVRESGMGLVIDPDDTASAASILEDALSSGYEASPDRDYLERFSSRSTNREFIDTLVEVIQSANAS
jgi:glycosyltransferase involved in cell wall biosynthesis